MDNPNTTKYHVLRYGYSALSFSEWLRERTVELKQKHMTRLDVFEAVSNFRVVTDNLGNLVKYIGKHQYVWEDEKEELWVDDIPKDLSKWKIEEPDKK